jgi:hypothetical protein
MVLSVVIVIGVGMTGEEWNWVRVMPVVSADGGMVGAEWNWLLVMSVVSVVGGGEL